MIREQVSKLLTSTPGWRLVVSCVTLLQLTRLALMLTLHRIVRKSPFEKPIPVLRARRLLRVRSTLRTALLGPSRVRNIVVPVREFERGRMPVQLVLNRCWVCLTVSSLVMLMHL